MNNKKISSFEIKKHNKFSWSYVYTIDGRKYDIHGDSTYDLRKKVLARDLPWDDENYPEDKLTKTQYDSMKAMKATIENSYTPYNEATKDYEDSQTRREWNPSSKKRDRYRDKPYWVHPQWKTHLKFNIALELRF